MGNSRGNKHSRRHIKLNPDKDKQYWNFSFHEMGTKDVPAIVDYIKNLSGVRKITYIGHSQGTAQMFVGLSVMPDYYIQNLQGMIALGPVTSLNNISSGFLKTMAEKKIDSFFKFLNINEIFPSSESVNSFTKIICDKIRSLCSGMLEMLADKNVNDDDENKFLVFASHFPSGSSLKNLRHFARIIRNTEFIDYNKKPYDLNKIKNFPISLFIGKDDKLATVNDNRILRNHLLNTNSLHFYKEYDNMGHATFFLNKNNLYIEDLLKSLSDFYSNIE